MAGMLGEEDRIIATDSNNNAGGDLRVVTLTAMAAQHRPFGFARIHFMPAVTTVFMRSVKLRQLYASSGQLKQPNIEINDLTYRPHIVTPLLLY